MEINKLIPLDQIGCHEFKFTELLDLESINQAGIMSRQTEATPVHCYTNPSFCRQSEYMPDDRNDLPPPLQFQSDDLPPPPSPRQLQQQYGQTNPAFQSQPETAVEIQPRGTATPDRYCYLDETRPTSHRRYGSLPVQEQQRLTYTHSSRYEYIQDDERTQLQRTGSSRYGFIPHQQVQRSAPPINQDNAQLQLRTSRNNGARYAVVPGDQEYQDDEASWNTAKVISPIRRQISTPQGILLCLYPGESFGLEFSLNQCKLFRNL